MFAFRAIIQFEILLLLLLLLLLLALEMNQLRRSARVSRLQKIPNTAIRNKMQAEKSILDRIQRRQLKWKIFIGQRRFTSGHRTVGGEEEDRNNHGGTK